MQCPVCRMRSTIIKVGSVFFFSGRNIFVSVKWTEKISAIRWESSTRTLSKQSSPAKDVQSNLYNVLAFIQMGIKCCSKAFKIPVLCCVKNCFTKVTKFLWKYERQLVHGNIFYALSIKEESFGIATNLSTWSKFYNFDLATNFSSWSKFCYFKWIFCLTTYFQTFG